MPPDVADLLLQNRAFLARIARDLAHTGADPDDVAQETARIAIERPPHTAATIAGWLQRVAHNVARRVRRGEQRRRQREEEIAALAHERATTADPADVLAQQQLIVATAQAVRDLDEPYRTAVHLRYYEDLTPQQIAAHTAANVATVKTRLRRARELLRTRLDGHAEPREWRRRLLALSAAWPLPTAIPTAFLVSTKTKVLLAAAIALVVALPFVLAHPANELPSLHRDAAVTAARTTAGEATAALRSDATPIALRGITGRTVNGGAAQGGVRLLCFVGPHPDGDANRWTKTERVTTSPDGSFAIDIENGTEVMFLLDDGRWRFAAAEPPRATAPADVRLDLLAVPSARVLVRATDVAKGTSLQTFTCTFHAGDDWPTPGGSWRGAVGSAQTTTGEAEVFVALPDGRPRRVQISLREPQQITERTTVYAGETVRVDLLLRDGDRVRGVVVDAAGKPIAGALVFAGTQTRARGDEPGKPFRGERIRDGVETDTTGAFEVATAAHAHVTAWHRDHSPRTVPLRAAARITLDALGGVHGRLVDDAGRPRADTELLADRTVVVRTDADGGFRIDGVEAGVRVLHVPGDSRTNLTRTNGGPWLVHVPPGGVADVALAPGFAELHGTVNGAGDARAFALIGLANGTSLASGALQEGVLRAQDVVAGDYLLATDRGALLRVTVDAPRLTVALGAPAANCWLTVEDASDATLHVAPSDADDVARTLLARLVRRRADGGGTLRIGPFAPGDYEVCRNGEPTGDTVRLRDAETRFPLPAR